MALRSFTELQGHRQPRALGVGAGMEPTTFWLTRHCREVHATDLYADIGSWRHTAPRRLLTDPAAAFTEFPWNPRRLVVQHMNGSALRYEDASFGFVYSSSSIEHFGTYDDAKAAMSEIGRVLEPGGAVSLSTEYLIKSEPRHPDDGTPVDQTRTLLFGRRHVDELIASSGLRRADEPSYAIGSAPVVSFRRALRDIRRHGEIRELPHIYLENQGHVFTSIHLALVKPV